MGRHLVEEAEAWARTAGCREVERYFRKDLD
jgi:hypothetical protein